MPKAPRLRTYSKQAPVCLPMAQGSLPLRILRCKGFLEVRYLHRGIRNVDMGGKWHKYDGGRRA